jgi:hypothetical protein
MQKPFTTSSAVALDPIQVLWVRGNFSRMELLSLKSFLAQGHPVHLYVYEAPANVPCGVDILEASDIVPVERVPKGLGKPMGKGTLASFSDFFRYKLLFERGGWWSDMDVVAIKPWSGFPDVVVASTEEKGYGRIANNFVLRFPAGHAIMKACYEFLVDKNLEELGTPETGPLLVHDIIGQEGVGKYAQPPEVFGPVPWNAAWQLLRSRWQRFSIGELKQRVRRPHLSIRFGPRSVSVHLWNEVWRKEGWGKEKRYAHSCLYEQLQRQFNPGG